MKLKLNDGTEYSITSLKEDLIPTSAGGNSWSLRFLITENVNSDDVENGFTADNMGELTVTADDGKTVKNFTGYKRLANASIVFDASTLTSVCQMHLQKVVEERRD